MNYQDKIAEAIKKVLDNSRGFGIWEVQEEIKKVHLSVLKLELDEKLSVKSEVITKKVSKI